MNHTLRDILWWLPMWTAMVFTAFYIGRARHDWSQRKVLYFVGVLGVLYFLWPVIGAVLFTYG